jgi:hypothetical protein
MQNNWLRIAALAAFLSGSSAAAFAAPPDEDEVPLTLSGCVKAGESRDSFLLTNVVIDGTTLAPAHAFYRFNTTDGLKDYVGRRVEVKGRADLSDVDRGRLRVRTEDGKVTTEITSERRTVEVEDLWFGSEGSMKIDMDVPTYKFNVDNVRPLEGNCASAGAAR